MPSSSSSSSAAAAAGTATSGSGTPTPSSAAGSSSSSTAVNLLHLARSTYSSLTNSSSSASASSSSTPTAAAFNSNSSVFKRSLPVEYWNAAKKRWTSDNCDFSVQSYKNSKSRKVLVLRQPFKDIHGGVISFKLDPTLRIEHAQPLARDFNAVFHGSGGKHRVAFFGEQEGLEFIRSLQAVYGVQVHKRSHDDVVVVEMRSDEVRRKPHLPQPRPLSTSSDKSNRSSSIWYEEEAEFGSRGLGDSKKTVVQFAGEEHFVSDENEVEEDYDDDDEDEDFLEVAAGGDLARVNFDDYPDEVFDGRRRSRKDKVTVQAELFYPAQDQQHHHQQQQHRPLSRTPNWIRKSFEELDLDISRTEGKLASSVQRQISKSSAKEQHHQRRDKEAEEISRSHHRRSKALRRRRRKKSSSEESSNGEETLV